MKLIQVILISVVLQTSAAYAQFYCTLGNPICSCNPGCCDVRESGSTATLTTTYLEPCIGLACPIYAQAEIQQKSSWCDYYSLQCLNSTACPCVEAIGWTSYSFIDTSMCTGVCGSPTLPAAHQVWMECPGPNQPIIIYR